MNSIETPIEGTTESSAAGKVNMNLEVVVIPVSNVDRAKRFYGGLGWRLDAEFADDDFRVMQMTPPGSRCSVIFGKGITTGVPGSVQDLMLVVSDIEAARAELVARGIAVSEVFHDDRGVFHQGGTKGRVPGADPERRSYRSYVSFSDPDGNGWLLQEVKTRLPGRGLGLDVPTLTELLREAEERHGRYEPTAPKHHWSRWYAAYIVAREDGRSPDEAAADAALHTEASRH